MQPSSDRIFFKCHANLNDEESHEYVIPSDLYEHRCYYQPCLSPPPQQQTSRYSLLVICIGMAQSILPYQSHVRSLAQHRNVLVYQAQGLGLFYDYDNNHNNNIMTNMNQNHTTPNRVALPYQAKQLRHAIQYYYFQHRPVEELNPSSYNDTIHNVDIDIVGFSLGGRIALAFIVDNILHQQQRLHPTTIHIHVRKVHLTGVSLRRSPYGMVQGMIWKDHLLQQQQQLHSENKSSDLRPFAWSILTAAYSPNYLYQNQQYLHSWVQSLCESHTSHGILHLIEQTYDHENDPSNPWSVLQMIQFISTSWHYKNNNNNNSDHNTIQFRCMVGENDLLALPEHVFEMAQTLSMRNHATSVTSTGNDNDVDHKHNHQRIDIVPVIVVPNVGHAVPIEASRIWRNDIQTYLSCAK